MFGTVRVERLSSCWRFNVYSNYRETIFGTLRVERLSEVQCVLFGTLKAASRRLSSSRYLKCIRTIVDYNY